MRKKDYYEVLEISKNASDEVIKNAYRALAKKYHPDSSKDSSEDVEKKMRQINEAYEILSNKEKRAIYDEELRLEKQKDNSSLNNNSEIDNSMVQKFTSKDIENEDSEEKGFWSRLSQKQKIALISAITFFVVIIITYIIVILSIDSSKLKNDETTKTEENKYDNEEDDIKTNNTKKSNNKVYYYEEPNDVRNYNDDEIINNTEQNNDTEDTLVKIY